MIDSGLNKMYQMNEFENREALDKALAEKITSELLEAIQLKGKASIALSGGSTPKGLFATLSNVDLPWDKVTVTLADERWVDIDNDASNTRLVHENLLVNNAKAAKFFHLKQGEELSAETLADMKLAANSTFLPFDVLILGMGEDGHTASLFPCSEQIKEGLDKNNTNVLMKVVPTTAPHDRITFTRQALSQSKTTILHITGASKKDVLINALSNTNEKEMPIRAFLHDPEVNTQVFWAE